MKTILSSRAMLGNSGMGGEWSEECHGYLRRRKRCVLGHLPAHLQDLWVGLIRNNTVANTIADDSPFQYVKKSKQYKMLPAPHSTHTVRVKKGPPLPQKEPFFFHHSTWKDYVSKNKK